MSVSVTFTPDRTGFVYRGRQKGTSGQLVCGGASAWPANGVAVTASTFNLSRLDSLTVEGMALDGTGAALASLAGWDKAAGKIMLFESAAATAEFGESNLSDMDDYIFRVTAWGS